MTSTKEVLNKIDMAKLLTQIGFAEVDPTKSAYLGYCVFHDDTNTKSFSANLDAKLFHCFGCRIRGNAIQLYALWKKVDVKVAKLELENEPDVRSTTFLDRQLNLKHSMPTWRRLQLLDECVRQLPLVTETPLKSYLLDRGLSEKVLNSFGVRAWKRIAVPDESISDLTALGVLDVSGRSVFESHPIIFPYWLGTAVTFLQGRKLDSDKSSPKYLGIHGTIPYAYNHEALLKSSEVVYFCEGVIDTLSMVQLGYPNTVGIPGVDAFKSTWLNDIRCKTVAFAFDNDTAGASGQNYLTSLLQQRGMTVAAWSGHTGFKDVNEYLTSRRQESP